MIKKKGYHSIIIGAGFSGLAAGLKLNNNNLDFLILEADEMIGGRSYNKILSDGTLLELGGQWIGYDHHEMQKLVKRYNLEIFETPPYSKGKYLNEYNNKIYLQIPQEIHDVLFKIDQLSKTINLITPYNHIQTKKWDNITLKQWLETENINIEIQKFIDRTISGALLATDYDQISFLQVLFYIASNGGVSKLTTYEQGAQHSRVIGGSESIAQCMANEIGNDNIKLNEYVVSIKYNNQEVQIITNNNEYIAYNAIIAIPPERAKLINYLPKLNSNHYELMNSFIPGKVLKVHFIYDKPFWRDNNYSRLVFKDNGFLTEITDNTTPKSKNAILTGFIYGQKKIDILENITLEQRQNYLLDEIVKFFGQKTLDFQQYIEYDWTSSQWSDGCFSSHFKLGSWTKSGKYWTKSYKNLYWTSTETSYLWNGYFEGAIISGYQTAQKVINKLNKFK